MLQPIDGWTTYRIVTRGCREANPLVRLLIGRLGSYRGVFVAKLLAIALVWLLALLPLEGIEPAAALSLEDLRLAGLLVLTIAYVAIVARNWNVLRGLSAGRR